MSMAGRLWLGEGEQMECPGARSGSSRAVDATQVEPEAIIAAGSYVEEGTVVPTGEVWAGNPAKKLRSLKPEERHYLRTLPGGTICS